MTKKNAIVDTMYRRKILEALKGVCPEGIERSELNDSNTDKGLLRTAMVTKFGIHNYDGSLHRPCNDMENEGLVVQVYVGKPGYRVYITPRGIGYLKALIDHEVGIPAA
jgi:hypothetical protein